MLSRQGGGVEQAAKTLITGPPHSYWQRACHRGGVEVSRQGGEVSKQGGPGEQAGGCR